MGKHWKRSASGMPAEASLRAIIFDPSNPDEVLYAGDFFSGVYRSTDGGKKWKQINNGLLNRAIQRLAISGDGLHLYATTEGGGVYRLDLNGLPPAEAPRPKQAAPTQSASTNANDPAQASQTGKTDPESASRLGHLADLCLGWRSAGGCCNAIGGHKAQIKKQVDRPG